MLDKEGKVAGVLPISVCIVVDDQCISIPRYAAPAPIAKVLLGVPEPARDPTKCEEEQASPNEADDQGCLSIADPHWPIRKPGLLHPGLVPSVLGLALSIPCLPPSAGHSHLQRRSSAKSNPCCPQSTEPS